MTPLLPQWIRLSARERLYPVSYPLVALTGGIASGKSTLANFFGSLGIPVISADQLIKDIYAWPQTKEWLQRLCPQVIQNNQIDFKLLRELVFQDMALKQQIENYLYPQLPQAFAIAENKFSSIPWLVYEIPLLFERQLNGKFDVVIVSWTTKEIQLQRLLARDPHSSLATAQAMVASQDSLDFKKKKSDLVFDNSGPLNSDAQQKIWKQLVGDSF